MNIKRIIDKNRKLIWYTMLAIIFSFIAIKSLNSYYEKDEKRKQKEAAEKAAQIQIIEDPETTPNYYATESNSIEKTIRSFVNYCNKKEIENAYKMLTNECKKAMFPTLEDFKRIYINKIYSIQREYELLKWSTDGNKITYLVTLYGDILASGGTNNKTQEYCTFIKDEKGNYKLNINNYIYGENKNIETTVNNITVKIGHVDVFDEYEKMEITIKNNTSKTICLTGNKFNKNIYLENSKGVAYSSLNSEFDNEEITIKPNSVKNFIIEFNKTYASNNKANYFVLSDVILDYEDFIKCEDKANFGNRTSIKIQYKK